VVLIYKWLFSHHILYIAEMKNKDIVFLTPFDVFYNFFIQYFNSPLNFVLNVLLSVNCGCN